MASPLQRARRQITRSTAHYNGRKGALDGCREQVSGSDLDRKNRGYASTVFSMPARSSVSRAKALGRTFKVPEALAAGARLRESYFWPRSRVDSWSRPAAGHPWRRTTMIGLLSYGLFLAILIALMRVGSVRDVRDRADAMAAVQAAREQ